MFCGWWVAKKVGGRMKKKRFELKQTEELKKYKEKKRKKKRRKKTEIYVSGVARTLEEQGRSGQ